MISTKTRKICSQQLDNHFERAETEDDVKQKKWHFFRMEAIIATLESKCSEGKDLKLSCAGLSSVNWDRGDDEFEFVFGDNKFCRVHSVLAEFLSPKVSRLRKSDALCGFYTFKNECHEVFESLVSSLRTGQPFRVEKSNFTPLLRLSHELENQEVLSSLFGMINTESLDIEEALLVLRFGIEMGMAFFRSILDVERCRFVAFS